MTDSIATNGDPVAWLLIHSTRGYRKIVISKKTAESWPGWDRHPLYTNSLPTVDAAKLRELVERTRRSGRIMVPVDVLESILDASEAT